MIRSSTSAATLLRRALLGNAVFSMASALLFLLATDSIARLAGAPAAEIQQTGVSLVVFVGLVAIVASRPDLQRTGALRGAILIAALDVLWVLTAPLKMLGYSPSGRLFFGVIAVIVLGFAVAQIVAIHKLMRTRRIQDPGAPMPGY